MNLTRNAPKEDLDDYPTPPWAGRALIEHVLKPIYGDFLKRSVALEPACNRGFLVQGIRDGFKSIYQTDIVDYRDVNPEQQQVIDFLDPSYNVPPIDFIITNPPYYVAEEFIQKSIAMPNVKGVAMLTRLAFLEGQKRYHQLYSKTPPTVVAVFCSRVHIKKGTETRKMSSPVAYSWMFWDLNKIQHVAPSLIWLPPTTK